MKVLLVLAVFVAGITDSRAADAFAACNNNYGFAPRTGLTLPKRARLLAFSDIKSSAGWQYSATLAGKQVKLERTEQFVAPYYMTRLDVDSDATGTLIVYRGTKQGPDNEIARYEVRADAAMPKDVTGAPRRFTNNIRHTSVKELYDALAVDIGDTTPAITATIKIRRDANAAWSTFDVPVNSGDRMDSRTTIRIGALGCASNYTVALLEQGVDLAISVTLADGSQRRVKLPAGQIVLPKASTKGPQYIQEWPWIFALWAQTRTAEETADPLRAELVHLVIAARSADENAARAIGHQLQELARDVGRAWLRDVCRRG